mgnify:CR=1 FL=1
MIGANNKILVEVDLDQKDTITIGGITLSTAGKFDTNYREKSPTVAKVIKGNDTVHSSDILLCHHNLFYMPSPYHVEGNLFSIPFSNILFAKIDAEGNITPICDNLICSRIIIPTDLPLPPEHQKTYDKVYNVEIGNEKYFKDDIVFTRPSAGYDIVYVVNGQEKRITKVDSTHICGVLRK